MSIRLHWRTGQVYGAHSYGARKQITNRGTSTGHETIYDFGAQLRGTKQSTTSGHNYGARKQITNTGHINGARKQITNTGHINGAPKQTTNSGHNYGARKQITNTGHIFRAPKQSTNTGHAYNARRISIRTGSRVLSCISFLLLFRFERQFWIHDFKISMAILIQAESTWAGQPGPVTRTIVDELVTYRPAFSV
jgi:hypothetical protein